MNEFKPNRPDRYSENFNLSELIKIDFRTGTYRKPIRDGETDQEINPNNEFPTYFYRSPEIESDNNDILIMVNGFDEKPNGLDLYYSTDFSISKILGNISTPISRKLRMDKNLISVLMPIPFHHWRRPLTDDYVELTSAQMIEKHNIRLFLGYRQLIYDIEKLVSSIIKGEYNYPLRNKCNDSTKIHLIGYSLGGLAVLSVFIKAFIQKHISLTSCTLLASGVDIENASFKFTDLNRKQVAALREYYQSDVFYTDYNQQLEITNKENEELILALFKDIVLRTYYREDDSLSIIDEAWVKLSRRIPIITAETDTIMNAQFVLTEFPKKARKLLITALDVHHGLVSSEPWKKFEALRTLSWAYDIMIRSALKTDKFDNRK